MNSCMNVISDTASVFPLQCIDDNIDQKLNELSNYNLKQCEPRVS